MAIFHLSAKVISRSNGGSAVASAAYRSGEEITAERTGEIHDYTRKQGVVHSEIIAPENAPDWATDRARLWNEVEAVEKRKDAQLAREMELSLPRELSPEQRVELVRDFVRTEFVSRGMVADFAIHEPRASDGREQPHAHVMMTTRTIGPEGFGPKERAWNDKALLEGWREHWAERINAHLERVNVAERVDHRTLEAQRAEALDRAADPARAPIERATAERQAQDLDREPQPKLGAATVAMERQGIQTDRGDQWRDVQARNAERQGLWQQVREWGHQIAVQAREKAMEVAERLREAAERLVPSPALAGGLDRLRAAGETMAQERAM